MTTTKRQAKPQRKPEPDLLVQGYQSTILQRIPPLAVHLMSLARSHADLLFRLDRLPQKLDLGQSFVSVPRRSGSEDEQFPLWHVVSGPLEG